MHISNTLERRFYENVNKTETCWIWTGWKNKRGYGSLHTGPKKKQERAHRISVVLSGREIPEGMYVDHICKNPSCVNPDHLRVVTPRVNALENSEAPSAKNAKRTHCMKGHELTPDNVNKKLYGMYGWRHCRTCQMVRASEKRKQEKLLPNWPEIRADRLKKKNERRRLYRLQNPLKEGAEDPFINPNKRRKLTPESVFEIRARYKDGESQKDLAIKFDVHHGTIHQIVTNKIWKVPVFEQIDAVTKCP